MQFAFFDICGHHPDTANERLVLADKMKIVAKKVREILETADRRPPTADRLDAPVLSTTCLGLQRVTPGMSVRTTVAGEERARVAFVPMDATTDEVSLALTKRRIVFERRGRALGRGALRCF